MSNEDVLLKFRSMMNKRKNAEESKKGSLNSEIKNRLNKEENSNENLNTTNNESVSVSTNDENKTKSQARGRTSVFELANRFERNKINVVNDKNEESSILKTNNIAVVNDKFDNEISNKESSGTLESVTNEINNKSELIANDNTGYITALKSTSKDNIEHISNNNNKFENNNNFKSDNNMIDINNTADNRVGRVSSFRNNLKQSRNSTNRSVAGIRNRPSYTGGTPCEEFRNSVYTASQRNSVLDLVKLNENRIKASRDTVTKKDYEEEFKNLANLKKLIERMNNGEDMLDNKDELMRCGIYEKGFKNVADIIGYYNKLANKKEEDDINLELSKQRKSVSVNQKPMFKYGNIFKDVQEPVNTVAKNNFSPIKKNEIDSKNSNKELISLNTSNLDNNGRISSMNNSGRFGVYSCKNPNLGKLKDLSGKEVSSHNSNKFLNKSNLRKNMTNSSNISDSTKYQKNIIESLNSISVQSYIVNPNARFDPSFFDVVCINCYECVKLKNVDAHSDYCIVSNEELYKDGYDNNEPDDYNIKIYKLHESFKNKKLEILKTKNAELINIYDELTNLIYEILVNNNSIEELDRSISKINEISVHKLNRLDQNNRFSLQIYIQRVSQLVRAKLDDMEKILKEIKDSNEDMLNKSNLSEEFENDYQDDRGVISRPSEQLKILKADLANIDKETQESKKELEQWRQEAKQLEKLLRKPNANLELLSDIQSEVVSRRDESVSC